MKIAIVILVALAVLTPTDATWSRRNNWWRARLQRQTCLRMFSQRPAPYGHRMSSYGHRIYRSFSSLGQGLRTLGHRTPYYHNRFHTGTQSLYELQVLLRAIYIERKRICCRLCPRLPGCSATRTASTTRGTTPTFTTAATTTRPTTTTPTTSTSTTTSTTAGPTTKPTTTTPTTPTSTTATTTTTPTTTTHIASTHAIQTTTTAKLTTAPTTTTTPTTTDFILPTRDSA